jgi:hypothetical protein
MAEHDDLRELASLKVQYLELREFASLLVSRRHIERVWLRQRRSAPEPRTLLRDATTGELFAAKMPPGTSLRASLLDVGL